MIQVLIPPAISSLVDELRELSSRGFTGRIEQHWKDGRPLQMYEEPHGAPAQLSQLLASQFEGIIEGEISAGRVLIRSARWRKDIAK